MSHVRDGAWVGPTVPPRQRLGLQSLWRLLRPSLGPAASQPCGPCTAVAVGPSSLPLSPPGGTPASPPRDGGLYHLPGGSEPRLAPLTLEHLPAAPPHWGDCLCLFINASPSGEGHCPPLGRGRTPSTPSGGEGHCPPLGWGRMPSSPLGPRPLWSITLPCRGPPGATRGHRRTSGEMGDGGEGQPSPRWDGLTCFRVSWVQGCSGKVGRWSAEVLTMWMGDAGSRPSWMLRRCEKSDLPGWMFAWGTRGPQDSAVSTQDWWPSPYLGRPGRGSGLDCGSWIHAICWIVVCGG